MADTDELLSEERMEAREYRIYESIWRNMDRENQLISSRIGWGIFLTAGLITANLLVLSNFANPGLPSTDTFKGLVFLLLTAFALGGLLFSWRVQEGVSAAQAQLKYLKGEFFRDQHRSNAKSRFEEKYGLPRPFGTSDNHKTGDRAAIVFPWILISFWALIAVVQISVCLSYFAAAI